MIPPWLRLRRAVWASVCWCIVAGTGFLGFAEAAFAADTAEVAGRVAPADIVTPPEHRRGVEQTFLTFPEWFLVFSPTEYAELVATRPPDEFVFWGHIHQFWASYKAVAGETRRRKDPPNAGYHVMILVIGISTTVEYAIRSAYETLVGRVAGLTNAGARTAEDEFGARVAQEYVDFIRVRPWYEFDFTAKLSALWRTTPAFGPGMLRKWERRYALTTEYGVKAAYGWLIGLGTHSAYEAPKPVTAVWFDRAAACADAPKTDRLRAFGDQSVLDLLPRYDAFTAASIQAARCGWGFREIAGNRSVILVSGLSQASAPEVPGARVLFTQPILTRPGFSRRVYLVPVTSLREVLLAMQTSGAMVEHVFDY